VFVHKENDDFAPKEQVNRTVSWKGAAIRATKPPWTGHVAHLPEDKQRVVVLASVATGIAPALQTKHTFLDARKGDGITLSIPEIHVVWFNQERIQKTKTSNPIFSLLPLSTELTPVDQLATDELERMRELHLGQLVVERIDIGGTFEHERGVINSRRQLSRPEISFWRK